MSTLADRTIEANRATHDRLERRVKQLDEPDLSLTSGSSDWSVAQVLSHLGSGAEIGLDTLRAAQAGTAREPDANETVWARWNALAPTEQAAGFLRADEDLVSAWEAVGSDQRDALRIPLGFLPEPVDAALATGLRLNEAVLHAWDVEVALDPAAVLPTDVAGVLLEQQRGPLSFLLRFAGKPERLGGRTADLLVHTSAPEARFGLSLGEHTALGEAPARPDGELDLPAEAFLRLLAGRLDARQTPAQVKATGALSMEDLRSVFPGF